MVRPRTAGATTSRAAEALFADEQQARPELDPEEIVALAAADPDCQPVVRRYCLTSGGHDSTVLAHRCRDLYDELAFIDTGTALPGVRDFVVEFAAWIGKPLKILEAGDAYRRLVLGSEEWWAAFAERREAIDAELRRRGDFVTPALIATEFTEILRAEGNRPLAAQAPIGFPGPAGHRFAYVRLKDRQVEQLVREAKAEHGGGGRAARVMLLTGVRIHESGRRKMTTAAQGFYERRGNQLWVNPLYDWTNERMRRYRAEHSLPESDVAAMIHRSGECNCGAFAGEGEREELRSIYPDWWHAPGGIAELEAEARRRGIAGCVWGQRPPGERPSTVGPMCSDCQLRLEVAA